MSIDSARKGAHDTDARAALNLAKTPGVRWHYLAPLLTLIRAHTRSSARFRVIGTLKNDWCARIIADELDIDWQPCEGGYEFSTRSPTRPAKTYGKYR